MTSLLRFDGVAVRDPAIDDWLSARPAGLGRIATEWFDEIRRCGGDVREVMHDGCPTGCVEDAGFAYVNVFTRHVNVGFFQGASLPDPAGLLQGTGKYMRHVKLRPDAPCDAQALRALIAAAHADILARLQTLRMQTPTIAGYSGTALHRKLGIKAAGRVCLLGAPEGFVERLEPLPEGVVFEQAVSPSTDLALVFATRKEELARHLGVLRRKLEPTAALWVSWPKKSSRVPTTITEDTIRELALPLGFVDIKVCAVSEVWSGLKLVVRKELR